MDEMTETLSDFLYTEQIEKVVRRSQERYIIDDHSCSNDEVLIRNAQNLAPVSEMKMTHLSPENTDLVGKTTTTIRSFHRRQSAQIKGQRIGTADTVMTPRSTKTAED